jgi:hypothetical protein
MKVFFQKCFNFLYTHQPKVLIENPKMAITEGNYRDCLVAVNVEFGRIKIEIRPQDENALEEIGLSELLVDAVAAMALPELHLSLSEVNLETTNCSMQILTWLNSLNKKEKVKVVWNSGKKKSHYNLGHRYSEMFDLPMIVRQY